jgi:hypothetical protein
VRRPASQPVDYLGVSPVYPTPTKTDTAAPWGLAGLSQVRGMTQLPLWMLKSVLKLPASLQWKLRRHAYNSGGKPTQRVVRT